MSDMKNKKTNFEVYEAGDDGNKIFHCLPHPEIPAFLWLFLTVFSAFIFAFLTGVIIIGILPTLSDPISPGFIIVCSIFIWFALVLLVRHSIKNLNSVSLVRFQPSHLSIQLQDKTVHNYRTNEISIHVHKVKRSDHSSFSDTRHFILTVKQQGKKIKYDILVEDSNQFQDFILYVQKMMAS